MALDPALLANLSFAALRTFYAVNVEMISTGTEINLIDGNGFVSFPVDGSTKTFLDTDPIFGGLAGITSIEERIASEAPTVSITLLPRSPDAFGEINQPRNQGSPVRIWWGIVDGDSGMVIGAPELLWVGRLDTVESKVEENTQTCELITVSGFDRLFNSNEGECLNQKWHQQFYPGETGLNFNVASTAEISWGVDAPRPSVSTGGGSYGGGGGYYRGGGAGGRDGGRGNNPNL